MQACGSAYTMTHGGTYGDGGGIEVELGVRCESRRMRALVAYGSDRRLKRLRLVRETKMEWPDSVRGRPDPILFGAPAGTGLYDGSVIFNMLAKVRESKSAPLPSSTPVRLVSVTF